VTGCVVILTGRLEMVFLVLTEAGAIHHEDTRDQRAAAANNNNTYNGANPSIKRKSGDGAGPAPKK
jgi:hypothetical protein